LSLGQPQSPVLTIDTEALFARSQFGQRISATLRTETEALAAENRRIEAELTAEEQGLTDRRPTMAVAAFRAEAEAFDTRVQAIRQEQDAKERALQEALNTGREAFLDAVSPVLAQLLRDSGALVILDRRSVVISVAAIDVTAEAVAAIDAGIGEGQGLWPPASAAAPAP
jgi:Skp family chaperone for outer membrane proteins